MAPILEDLAPGYRIEKKYYLSLSEAAALRERLDPIMHRDPHADAHRHYLVKSAYLDDRDEHSLAASLLGLEKRKKYRVRTYNDSDDFIGLEAKIKRGNYSYKECIRITRDDYESLLRGDPDPLKAYDCDLARRLYFDMRANGYRLRCLVCYDREVYLHPIQRTRITLDSNICCAVGSCDLFAPHHFLPVFPAGVVLLEVKYNHFLPEFISDLLPRDAMPATANSKFARSRAVTDWSTLQ